MNIKILRDKNINHDPLITKPEMIYVKDFNEDAYKKLKEDFSKAVNANFDIIPVVIDSYGGSVDALLGMISIFQNSPVPVATILETKAMSCGVILFSCGTKNYRFASEHSTLMIHEVSNFSGGKLEELKSSLEYADLLNSKIFSILDQNTGHKKGFFKNELKKRNNSDWFLDAVGAKEIGIVDHIKVPNFNVKITQNCVLE